jgi:hypothetical protein
MLLYKKSTKIFGASYVITTTVTNLLVTIWLPPSAPYLCPCSRSLRAPVCAPSTPSSALRLHPVHLASVVNLCPQKKPCPHVILCPQGKCGRSAKGGGRPDVVLPRPDAGPSRRKKKGPRTSFLTTLHLLNNTRHTSWIVQRNNLFWMNSVMPQSIIAINQVHLYCNQHVGQGCHVLDFVYLPRLLVQHVCLILSLMFI